MLLVTRLMRQIYSSEYLLVKIGVFLCFCRRRAYVLILIERGTQASETRCPYNPHEKLQLKRGRYNLTPPAMILLCFSSLQTGVLKLKYLNKGKRDNRLYLCQRLIMDQLIRINKICPGLKQKLDVLHSRLER